MNWHSKHINTSSLIKLLGLFILLSLSACAGKKTAENASASDALPQNLPILSRDENGENHKIRPFRFTDQDGKAFDSKRLDNKIYIADFFFTTCPSICPKMTGNMKKVHEAFPNDSNVYFVSFSIDPEYDNPQILKQYASEKANDAPNWRFLTGDKDSIYTICEEDFMAYAMPDKDEPGGYVHSGFLILIDPNGQIRGAFDGTTMGKSEELIEHIQILKTEFQIP